MAEFLGKYIPPYAILSHRWEAPENELTFKDFKKDLKLGTSGWRKIRKFCQIARADRLDWAWIDTCCIDKRSSAELSESINSMFAWYRNASRCYAYLNDVDSQRGWRQSVWWTRGWTLQELIAPSDIVFFNKEWQKLGTKLTMATEIERITAIPRPVLTAAEHKLYRHYSVAQKMSWAAGRETTRVEDRAYCLLGLFHINMSLLYGEGEKAFQRLQLQILQKHSDESILAWAPKVSHPHLVLAGSPDDFAGCMAMYPPNVSEPEGPVQIMTPLRATSLGIELWAEAWRLTPRDADYNAVTAGHDSWAVTLSTMWDLRKRSLPCTVILVSAGPVDSIYRRLDAFFVHPAEALMHLSRQWVVDGATQHRRFYLSFDPDFDFKAFG